MLTPVKKFTRQLINTTRGIGKINITHTCADKNKQTLSTYDIKDKENTPSNSEKKGKACDGYVNIYEYDKHLIHSMHKHACVAQEMPIGMMQDIVEIYSH